MRLRNIPGSREEIAQSPYVVLDSLALRGNWQKRFGNQGPIHLEVGMGKGQFLMELARQNPQINYVGVEMYSSVLLRAIQRRQALEEAGWACSNLLYLREDARLLPDIFGPEEVDRLYLNFSDPWPKARHEDRRLTSQRFLARYRKFLAKEALLEFKTDNQELFDFSLEEIEQAGWELLAATRDLYKTPSLLEGNIPTEYEQKFSAQGKPICKLLARQR